MMVLKRCLYNQKKDITTISSNKGLDIPTRGEVEITTGAKITAVDPKGIKIS